MDTRLTEFRMKVYAAVSMIPKGKVSTYSRVARYIGCGSPRAVGQALRVNPFAPEVPCHRVVSSDLTLGGFDGAIAGERIDLKRQLLMAEGVKFSGQGTVVDPDCLYDFT